MDTRLPLFDITFPTNIVPGKLPILRIILRLPALAIIIKIFVLLQLLEPLHFFFTSCIIFHFYVMVIDLVWDAWVLEHSNKNNDQIERLDGNY